MSLANWHIAMTTLEWPKESCSQSEEWKVHHNHKIKHYVRLLLLSFKNKSDHSFGTGVVQLHAFCGDLLQCNWKHGLAWKQPWICGYLTTPGQNQRT